MTLDDVRPENKVLEWTLYAPSGADEPANPLGLPNTTATVPSVSAAPFSGEMYFWFGILMAV